MSKKLFSFMLAFLLLLPAGIYATAEDESAVTQIGDLNVRFLDAIGVFDSVNLGDITAPVTRAEAAGVIVEIMAESFLDLSPTSDYFSDVAPDDPAAKQIYAAVRLGVLNGFDDGTFRPEEALTIQQVAKIYVSMLNYTYQAESKGGYPTGYLSVAAGLGLLNGIDQNSQAVSRIDFARITANALEVDMVIPLSYGENAEYEIQKGRNMLTEYLGVMKARGKVDANSRGGLRGMESTSEGNVRINGELYAQGNTTASELLGLSVDFYYLNTDNSIPEILYLAPRQYSSIMLTAQDMDGIERGNGRFVLSYTIGDQSDEIEVSFAADVIMNGGVMLDVDAEDLVPNSGYSRFIDTDADGIYDLVQVTSAQTVHVSGIDARTKKIYDENANCYDFSEAKEITVTGEIGDFAGITMGNVVSIYETADGKYVRIVVSTKSVEGVLEEITNEGTRGFYRIGGNQYEVDSGLWEKMQEQKNSADSPNSSIIIPEAGLSYRFILNIDNVIIDVESMQSELVQYGFLCGFDSKSNIDSNVSVKIMTESGEFKIYTANETMLTTYGTDGIAVKEKLEGSQLAKHPVFYNGDIFKPQLIYFRANNKDELVSVETAADATAVGFDNTRFSYDGAVTNEYFRTPGDVFNQWAVDGNTTVFSVSCINGVVDEKKSAIVDLVHAVRYTAKFYDADETGVARVVLLEEGETPGTVSEHATLIEKSRTVYENDEECVRIKGYNQGQVVNYIASESIAERAKALTPGDIIRPKVTSSGELTDFEMILDKNLADPDAEETFILPTSGLDAIFVSVYGLARYKSDKGIVLSGLEEGSTKVMNFNGTVTKTYVVEAKPNGDAIITSGSSNDILAIPTGDGASKVYIQRRYNCNYLVVIYK